MGILAHAHKPDPQDQEPHQQPLPTGPIGIASRSAPPPDNGQFWPQVNAVTFAQRGAGRRAAYRAVAFFCSLKAERVCYAAVATQADRAGLGVTMMRGHLQWFEANGYIAATGSRTGGRPSHTRPKAIHYSLILPPPDTLKAPVSGGLKAPVSGPKERKEVQSITTFLKKAPDGEDVRTPENQPPPPIPQDLSYPPVPSFSHVPYGKQTRLYAKLYRKLATPNWPPLTDDLLDVFESHRYQTKKTILDGLLDQEQRLRGPGPLQAPGSHSEASSIVNMLGAALTGTRTPADDSGLLRLQTACEQRGHTWTEDETFRECHKCGKSIIKPHESQDTLTPHARE